jgi:deoxyhypusine synthase
VDLTYEQMVYSEATLALPLIAGYAFHKKGYVERTGKKFGEVLDHVAVSA